MERFSSILFLLVCQIKIALVQHRNKVKSHFHNVLCQQHHWSERTKGGLKPSKAGSRNRADNCCFSKFTAQVVMKFLCTFRAALLSFCSLCLWSKTEVMMGGKQWKPQRAWSGTSQMKASSPPSSDAYLPCLHTSTHFFGPTTRLPETFSQLWSNRQSTKRTHCFTDTHLPAVISCRLLNSRSEIKQKLCFYCS